MVADSSVHVIVLKGLEGSRLWGAKCIGLSTLKSSRFLLDGIEQEAEAEAEQEENFPS